MSNVILFIFIMMNIIGFFIMKVDKQRAIKHQYRISERTLWLVALLGGAIGSTISMNTYRHKTKHLSFKIGFPLLAVIEFMLYLYLYI
ncbi:DUF1294 domain-containing protein [Bacillus sp. V3B]|uniref:DUF1294 domain-containing protein n=1 Tax=Bacillus sp. V3B TaxID=2804915 RepID=UPI0021099567|nr:DUF1294 domain-containing protein [Bacillus sp. V3B]MCQ6273452.1 DUF1294 domain-containing protein [Bacillus sp. V3B]